MPDAVCPECGAERLAGWSGCPACGRQPARVEGLVQSRAVSDDRIAGEGLEPPARQQGGRQREFDPRRLSYPKPRRAAVLLAWLAVGVTVPLIAFFALTRPGIGNPNQYTKTVVVGMTADQVRAVLGAPHERYTYPDGAESWIYYCDRLGVTYLGIRFSPDGRVEGKWT